MQLCTELIDPGLISVNLGQERISSLSRALWLKTDTPLSCVFIASNIESLKRKTDATHLVRDMALFCWTFSRLDYKDKKS